MRLIFKFTEASRRNFPEKCEQLFRNLQDATEFCELTQNKPPLLSQRDGIFSEAALDVEDPKDQLGSNVGIAIAGTAGEMAAEAFGDGIDMDIRNETDPDEPYGFFTLDIKG